MSPVEFEGVSGFNESIDALIASVKQATRRASVESAAEVVKAAQRQFNGQHAPGTPRTMGGNRPQSISGDLSRSIHMIGEPIEVTAGIYQTRVAPTMIYARRIELGFAGTDSIGRVYPSSTPNSLNVPPYAYPYLEPGLLRARPTIDAIFESRWNAALRV